MIVAVFKAALVLLLSLFAFHFGLQHAKHKELRLGQSETIRCSTHSATLVEEVSYKIEEISNENCPPVSQSMVAQSAPPASLSVSNPSIVGAPIERSFHEIPGTVNGGVLQQFFSKLHHPDGPTKTELLLDRYHTPTAEEMLSNPYAHCDEIYLTRTGASTGMRNKCLAVGIVQQGATSPYIHSHRMGLSAGLQDKYQGDILDMPSFKQETVLLPLFIEHMESAVKAFQELMGAALDDQGERRAVIVMVANEGVLDLVLNFLCSCKESNINVSDRLVVFLGQPELAPVLQQMGVRTFHDEALGPIPKKAAGFYGDQIFSVMMWLKTTAVYVACRAGFNVLFQDTDLVWVKDPLPYLQQTIQDIAFMDDGARTTRFTPFFENSGFYYLKHNTRTLYLMEKMMKSISEIAMTHSHQATLTRHITESHHLMGLQVAILRQEDFPSGMIYHHNKKYIADMKQYQQIPYVFHMCWTTSRKEKVDYFKDVGMWLLPEGQQMCLSAEEMFKWVSSRSQRVQLNPQRLRSHSVDSNLLNYCCSPKGTYWEHLPAQTHE